MPFMRVKCYIQPKRTFTPCTGVGRHINNMILELARLPSVEVELLFSREYLGEGRCLPQAAPLRDLAFSTYSWSERLLERSWKLCGFPLIESSLSGFDLLYSPSDVVFPHSKLPKIVTLHDIHPLDPLFPDFRVKPRFNSQQHRWSVWVPKLFANSTVVCTVSEFCKRRMEHLVDTKGKRIYVTGNGVDPVFFDVSAMADGECSRAGEWPYIVVIGGLTDRKGGGSIIEVAKLLQQRKSDIRIVVIGGCERHWEEAASSLSNVVLAGKMNDRKMAEYLRCSIGLLFLSRYEGFGIPILEAMAVGVPVIVADSSSLPEVAGEAGYIVPSDDTTQIACHVESLLNRSQDLINRIAMGRKRAAIYTWKACCNRLQAAMDFALTCERA